MDSNPMFSHSLLSVEETQRLLAQVRQGDDEARKTLIAHNMLLVKSIANRYQDRGIDLEDLVSEGVIGLNRAIVKYDPNKGAALSTYAVIRIRQAVTRAIMNNSREIRIPIHILDKRREVAKKANELSNMLGRKPLPSEIAEALGIKEEDIFHLFDQVGHAQCSINDQIGDGDSTIGDILKDENSTSPDGMVMAKEEVVEVAKQIKFFLTCLYGLSDVISSRDIKIFKTFYGLNGDSFLSLTLEDVSGEFQITRERVRQIVKQIWSIYRKAYAGSIYHHDSLVSMIEQLCKLLEIVGSTEGLGQLLGSTSLNPNEAPRPVRLTKREISGRLKVNRIYASPSYKTWTPNGTAYGNRFEMLTSYISETFEVSVVDIKTSGQNKHSRQDLTWAKALIVKIAYRDLRYSREVISTEFAINSNQFSQCLNAFDYKIKEDEVMRSESELITEHFLRVSTTTG